MDSCEHLLRCRKKILQAKTKGIYTLEKVSQKCENLNFSKKAEKPAAAAAASQPPEDLSPSFDFNLDKTCVRQEIEVICLSDPIFHVKKTAYDEITCCLGEVKQISSQRA